MGGAIPAAGAAGTELVLVGADNGVVVVTSDTPLRRLNYFDGKFLRAEDLQAEQDYLRFLVQLSNRAGGSGVVNGYDTVLAPGGAAVTVGQGLAIDALGRVLLMPIARTMALDDLVAATARAQQRLATGPAGPASFGDCVVAGPPTATAAGQTGDLYLLTVGFLEALCGEEDVFGQLCDDACVQSKDRRWRMEGVVFRAVPLTLATPLETPAAVGANERQLRNRVASAYFQDERARVPSLVGGASIRESATWCLGARAELGDSVPLAVFARSGGVTRFLDAWTARRERMEPPPRRYWAARLAMRPWDAFLAQVLQFQCQLHDLLSGKGDGGSGGGGDPCAPKTAALGRAAELLAKVEAWHAKVVGVLTPARLDGADLQPFDVGALTALRTELSEVAVSAGGTAGDRVLLDGGFLELPPAGYLPIDVSGKLTVNAQVRAFMGPGVDLRFCIVTPDFVPHALELRQHMERIPLARGIDDPAARPKVDVLVPGGRIVEDPLAGGGAAFQLRADARGYQQLLGAANGARREGTGATITLAATSAGVALDRLVASLKAIGSGSQPDAEAAAPAAITRAHVELATRTAARATAEAFASRDGGPPATAPLFELASRGDLAGAVESTASIDADPFQLEVSGSTGLRLELFLGVKGDAASLARLTAGGTLFVRTNGTTPQGIDHLLGTVSGSYAVSGTGSTSPGENVVWQYELLRKASVGAGTVHARLLPRTDVAARLPLLAAWYTWNGDPLQGVLRVFELGDRLRASTAAGSAFGSSAYASLAELPAPPETQPLFELDLTRDPAVQDPTEQHHVLARSALEILAAMMVNGPDWQKAAESALFPRPPAGAGNLTVLGERDWVLFARRRLDTCAEEVVTPRQPNRHYHLYAHEAKDEQEGEAWVKAVLGGAGGIRRRALPRLRRLRRRHRRAGRRRRAALLARAAHGRRAPARRDRERLRGRQLRGEPPPGPPRAGRGIRAGRRRGVARRPRRATEGVRGARRRRADRARRGHPGRRPAARGRERPGRGLGDRQGRPLRGERRRHAHRERPDAARVGGPLHLARFGEVPQPHCRSGRPRQRRRGVGEVRRLAKGRPHRGGRRHDEGFGRGGRMRRPGPRRAPSRRGRSPGRTPTHWNSHTSEAFTDVDALAFLVLGPEAQAPALAASVSFVKADGLSTVKPLLEEGRVNEVLTRLKRFLQPVERAELEPGTGALRDPDAVRSAWREALGDASASAVMTFVEGNDGGLGREVRAQAKSVAAAVAVARSAPAVSVLKVTDGAEEVAPGAIPVFHFVLPKG